MALDKERQFIMGFLDLYQAHECLWRVKAKDYSNKLKRRRGPHGNVGVFQKVYQRCGPKLNKEKDPKFEDNLQKRAEQGQGVQKVLERYE